MLTAWIASGIALASAAAGARAADNTSPAAAPTQIADWTQREMAGLTLPSY
ncbi:hypothetical protein [Burkholderia sp. F1]|uniref:hypothetical protein n=1 Tax=Burkholderia sp. F1 TaxID=3366817 RepID=UPI003D759C34